MKDSSLAGQTSLPEDAPAPLARLSAAERLNFLLTNRIPRRLATRAVGWLSRQRHPLIRVPCMALWQLFADDLRLFEARKSTFESMQDCFTRELKPGARPVHGGDDVLVSPCDAEIGAFGSLRGTTALQAKGFPYSVDELLGEADAVGDLTQFATLRLKSSMYHRFHAPVAGGIKTVRYISGDTWNVNPIALRAVERLFCRNERVVLRIDTRSGGAITLVAVAAVAVATIRIHGLAEKLDLRYGGPNELPCERRFEKGDELGYFEQGSTIILLAPPSYRFTPDLTGGKIIRCGEPLMLRDTSVTAT